MGYTSDEGNLGVVIKSTNSEKKEFGYGHIITKLVGGVKKYKVEFFPRVRWTKFTADGKTKGEGTEFGTATIEGVVLPLENEFKLAVATGSETLGSGVWEIHHTFDKYEEAQAMLVAVLTPIVA